MLIRFIGIRFLWTVIAAQFLSILLFFLTSLYFERTFDFVFYTLIFFSSIFLGCGGRIAVREFIFFSKKEQLRVLIYGSGDLGAQILASIRQDSKYKVMGFVDDDISLHGAEIQGLRIYAPYLLTKLVIQKEISLVVVVKSNKNKAKLQKILEELLPLQ